MDGHPSIKLDITMAMDKDFGNREAAMTLRDMAESVLGDDESLGDILIAGDSKFPGYKVKANEIDALDKLLFLSASVCQRNSPLWGKTWGR